MSDEATIVQDETDRVRTREASRAPTDPPGHPRGYEIRRFLGKGAFGEVWQAIDRATDVPVAIKFFRGRGGMDWALLLREVEKLRFLANDQRVVRLREVGRDAKPPYYVMEYMEGGSLEDVLRRRGSLPVDEALTIAGAVAAGLEHAHRRDILHCDLKPANVLLDGNGDPRLADFGQARLSKDKTPALGTLLYMAPEQADLDAEPDVRWDVYSFGALLHRTIVGQPPHAHLMPRLDAGRTGGLRERLAEYRRLIAESPPPRDHRRAPDVDRALATIIETCLQVDPRRRYATIAEVRKAFARRLADEAQRPLLALGVVGPLLLIATVGLIGYSAVDRMSRDATAQLVEDAEGVTQFGADLVAERVANVVGRRLDLLQTIANDPVFVATFTEAARARRPGDAPSRFPTSDPGRRLRQLLANLAGKHGSAIEANSWIVCDSEGTMLARVPDPAAESINANWAFRDFFHGSGRDLERGARAAPIDAPYRSQLFKNAESDTQQRAGFSVPIGTGPGRGVLTITLEERSFVGLALDADWKHGELARVLDDLVPVLIDGRGPGRDPLALVVAHPIDLKPEMNDAEHRAHAVVDVGRWFPGSVRTIADYRDPFGESHPDYAGRWIASFHPVDAAVDGHVVDTGWSIIMQSRYESAVAPVKDLRDTMVRGGLIAFATVGVLVALLWLFVLHVLDPRRRSWWLRAVRRRLGLPDRTTGGGTTRTGSVPIGSLALSTAAVAAAPTPPEAP